jgi:hypothetical protein
MSLSRPSLALTGGVILALASPARAQSNNPAVATELFNAGRDLMKAGNYVEACPKLASSARLDAKVGTLARLAECEEKVGQMVNARAHWEQAVNLARSEQDARLDHAASELARVDKLVPKIDVVWHGPVPAGCTLLIDSLDVGTASFGLALPVDAGSHTVVVTAPGKKPWTTTIQTKESGGLTTLDVPALSDGAAGPAVVLAPPSPGPPPTEAATPPARRGWTPMRIAGFVTADVGAVALVLGATFGVLTKVKLDDSNQGGCGANNSCNAAGFALRNDARTFGDVSTGLFIAGGLLAATGVTLFVVGSRPKEASEGTRAALSVGPESVVVRGSF